MLIGKRFRSSSGSLRHLMHIIVRPDGSDVIVSKEWQSYKGAWTYHAETRDDVENGIRFYKYFKK